MNELLLHCCCAPCSIACVDSLREEGFRLAAYWCNGNIHPFTEYRARRDALADYAAAIEMPLLMDDRYGLRDFLAATQADTAFGPRCTQCYAARLDATARRAAAEGYPAFSTTLLISPYQNHLQLQAAGEDAARKYGVAFLYRDFRPLFREGQGRARELGLYMQKYCGCIFSEEERYSREYKKKKGRG